MILYRPVKSNLLSQKFGESKACVNNFNHVVAKVPYSDTGNCPVGYVSLYEKFGYLGHNGEDWSCAKGEPIVFPLDVDGVEWICKTETDKEGGVGVDVFSLSQVGDLGYIKFRFWHLETSNVYDGQKIRFGDILGFGDSTGLSSANHLHWSLKQTYQTTLTKFGATKNKTNGYAGAIDFRKHFKFENVWVGDILQQKLSLLMQLLILMKKVAEYFK